ncbi:MAG: portal protein [Candidatus Thorarchaeota archaeon]|jgi:hypothetical protein
MPPIIHGNTAATRRTDKGALEEKDYGYEYPGGLDLKPGSQLHDALVSKILERAQASHNVMVNRHPSWYKIDETLTAYIPTDAEEEKVTDDDSRKSVSIVIPYSYAVLETLLTYSTAAFLENPIFKYRGVGPEDTLGAILLELAVDLQAKRSKMSLNLYTMFRDAFAYGFGVVAPVWEVRHGNVVRQRKTQGFISSAFNRFRGKRPTGTVGTRREVVYEGNTLENIDPYQFLPDPNVPINRVQDGEYVGWVDRDNRLSILERERNDTTDTLFNAKYLAHIDGRSTLYQETDQKGSRTRYEMDVDVDSSAGVTNVVDPVYMYVNLIPSEWDVGDSDYPEKWLFALAGDEVIISAKKQNYNHNMFPVAVCAPSFDGYSVSPVSQLEMLYGMQHRIDWFMNSHQKNVRRAVNDIVVVDPSMIDTDSLVNAKEGGVVFLKNRVWGKGTIDQAVKQLGMTDITKNHVQDAINLMQVIERVSGATDNMQGIAQKLGERVTRYQVQSAKTSALSRMEMKNKLVGVMTFTDLAVQLAENTIQFMNEDVYVEVFGRAADALRKDFGITSDREKVTPFDVAVGYDVVPQDGSVMASEYLDTWVSLFQIISQNPMLAQLAKIDLGRMFKHIARMGGAKNIDDFVIKDGDEMEVAPDEDVLSQAQRGNIVPMGGQM